MKKITSLTPIKIWGKCYNLRELQKIGQGKIEDDLLEWLHQDLDYICDCEEARPYVVYSWNFENKQKRGELVDIYVVHYTDTDTIAFNGDRKKDFIYYHKTPK